MGAQFRSWWQYIRKHWIVTIIIAVVIAAMILILVGILINGTGLNGYNQVTTAHTISGPSAGTVVRTEVSQPGKTLWDWLQLLIIPILLAIGGYWLNRILQSREQRITEHRDKTEHDIASDNQRETALQAYIDKMSELLLDKDNPLRESADDDEVRKIARVRTLTVLNHLDGRRKATVLNFLSEADLIKKNKSIIDLIGANLSEADLEPFSISGAHHISYALDGENLSGANLSGANLSEVDLSRADLSKANLSEADLSGANLKDAIGITVEELEKQAKSLKGATMPDGSIHP